MTEANSAASARTSRVIKAPRDEYLTAFGFAREEQARPPVAAVDAPDREKGL